MMTKESNIVLNWDQYQQETTSTLKNIWENEAFLDVTIACDDDQIDAHKVVLSAASPFFRNILKRNPHSHPLLYLKGTSKKTMQALLHFIYSGKTQIVPEDLDEFMALAKSLRVKALVKEDEKTEASDIELDKNAGYVEKDNHVEPVQKSLIQEREKLETSKIKDKKAKKKENNLHAEDDVKIGLSVIEQFDVVEIGIEQDNSEDFAISENSVESESFASKIMSELSMTADYAEKVSSLYVRSGSEWMCKDCQYMCKRKDQMKEHVEIHIKGFKFECNTCQKIYNSKCTLRKHFIKCQRSWLNNY